MPSPQFVQHLELCLKRLQILWGIYVIPFPFLIIGLHFSLCSLKNVTSSWKAAFSNCPVTWKTLGQPVFSHGVEVQSKTVKSFLMICDLQAKLLENVHATSLSLSFSLSITGCAAVHKWDMDGAIPHWHIRADAHFLMVHHCVHFHNWRAGRFISWWDIVN